MAQIPDRDRTDLVDLGGDVGHVVHVAGLVVHVGEQHDGDVFIQRGLDALHTIDQLQFVVGVAERREQVHQALGDVQVGREVVALGDDHAALGLRFLLAQRGGHHLEQVGGGGVGDDHFVFLAAHETCQLVAQLARHVEPARRIPTANQADAPFLGDIS